MKSQVAMLPTLAFAICILALWVQTGRAGDAVQFTVARRLPGGPIIRAEMLPGEDGATINGPSLIRAPSWLPNRLVGGQPTRRRVLETFRHGRVHEAAGQVAADISRRILPSPRLGLDDGAQARMEELADKNSDGQLTPEERAEYEAWVSACDLVAILQSKARAWLKGPPIA